MGWLCFSPPLLADTHVPEKAGVASAPNAVHRVNILHGFCTSRRSMFMPRSAANCRLLFLRPCRIGVTLLDGPFLDFRDPWGNRVEIVGYDNIQFTKAPNVLRGMGLMHLGKNEKAKKELAEKGMALD